MVLVSVFVSGVPLIVDTIVTVSVKVLLGNVIVLITVMPGLLIVVTIVCPFSSCVTV